MNEVVSCMGSGEPELGAADFWLLPFFISFFGGQPAVPLNDEQKAKVKAKLAEGGLEKMWVTVRENIQKNPSPSRLTLFVDLMDYVISIHQQSQNSPVPEDALLDSMLEAKPSLTREAIPAAQQITSLHTGQRQYAGFWIRVGACFIDLIVMMIPSFIIFIIISAFIRYSIPVTNLRELENLTIISTILYYIVSGIAGWFYCAALESSAWQGTIGKKLLGLKVIDSDGNRISFGTATGRYVAKFIAAIPLGMGIIEIAFSEKKQGLHDCMAGTYVVHSGQRV